jgi:hypothetical protein
MSWKLSSLAIALLGLAGSSLAAGGERAPSKDARPQSNAPAVVSGDRSPIKVAISAGNTLGNTPSAEPKKAEKGTADGSTEPFAE